MSNINEGEYRIDTQQSLESDGYEVDAQEVKSALAQIHARFVDERVSGFTPPGGKWNAPVDRAEAEARWSAVESNFQQLLLKPSADTARKTMPKAKPPLKSSDYGSDEGRPGGADFDTMQGDWDASKRNRAYQRTGESVEHRPQVFQESLAPVKYPLIQYQK